MKILSAIRIVSFEDILRIVAVDDLPLVGCSGQRDRAGNRGLAELGRPGKHDVRPTVEVREGTVVSGSSFEARRVAVRKLEERLAAGADPVVDCVGDQLTEIAEAQSSG